MRLAQRRADALVELARRPGTAMVREIFAGSSYYAPMPAEKVRLRIGNLAKAVLVTGQAYQDPNLTRRRQASPAVLRRIAGTT